MAIDTTSVTSVITTFRTETRENSITPSRLGSLLQSIVDLFKNCAASSSSSSSTTTTTVTAIKSITYSWTRTQTGLTLNLLMTDTNGKNTTLTIPVPIVSTTQAGIVTSAQLASLSDNSSGNSSSGGSSSGDSGSTTGGDDTGGTTGDDSGGTSTSLTMYLGFLDYTITAASSALAALPSSTNVVAQTVTSAKGTFSVTNPVAGNYMWIAVPVSLSQPTSFTSSGLSFPFEDGVQSGDYYLYRSSDRLKANTVSITIS